MTLSTVLPLVWAVVFVLLGMAEWVLWVVTLIDALTVASRLRRGEAVLPWRFF